MRNAGWIILAIGVLVVIFSLFMDVSVSAGNGYRVNNIGLMAQRQNFIIISGIAIVVGLLLAIFANKITSTSRKCPFCAEAISREAIKCKHCGSNIAAEGDSVGLAPPELPENGDRLEGVNIKAIIGIAVAVLVAVVVYIVIYRAV